MMHENTSQYQRGFNHTQQYNHSGNIVIHPTIQMSPYVQQVPRQTSATCFSVDARSMTGPQVIMPSSMSLNDYSSHSNRIISQSPQISGWNLNHQGFVPPLTLDEQAVYSCSFLGQLQGDYEVETPVGKDHVSVFVPTVSEGEEQYAIVRRVCSDGEALPDQVIYQEPHQFTLHTVDSVKNNVEAILIRGSNMKYGVNWLNLGDGGYTVWRRKGDVTFNLVNVESLASSRRHSIGSVGSALSSSVYSPIVVSNGMTTKIRSELFHQSPAPSIKPLLLNFSSHGSQVSNLSSDSNMSYNPSQTDVEINTREETIFELIKAECLGNAGLLKRVLHWANGNTSTRPLSSEDMQSLSKGRLWVTAHPVNFEDDVEIEYGLQESLENIKGAYKEVRNGVWKQPEPQVNEPGVQHRLMKGQRGRWNIESHDVDTGDWILCAEQLSDGRWVDIKNNREVIRVQLIPMHKILQKMSEEIAEENQEMEKCIEFLFTNCNQKKLNSKLKGRNLKHNISNLKLKLEKQYALSFAVQVATTADTIAMDSSIS